MRDDVSGMRRVTVVWGVVKAQQVFVHFLIQGCDPHKNRNNWVVLNYPVVGHNLRFGKAEAGNSYHDLCVYSVYLSGYIWRSILCASLSPSLFLSLSPSPSLPVLIIYIYICVCVCLYVYLIIYISSDFTYIHKILDVMDACDMFPWWEAIQGHHYPIKQVAVIPKVKTIPHIIEDAVTHAIYSKWKTVFDLWISGIRKIRKSM